ncbi:MAG: TonB-dependent receptor, partial [Bacteroidota bacterium]|nr:TonB-dependent receptor [Bacteroidota bacterium]
MREFFSVILLFLTTFAFPQSTTTGSLKGHITAEGEKMDLASISLLKTTFSTNSDKRGQFELEGVPPGKYQLRITYVGYENFQQEVIITSEGQTEVAAELIPLASNLKELVVTGTLKEVSKLQSVTAVDVYTSKFFLRNPSANVWEALGNINGVFPDVDQGVSNTSDVQINGLEGNYTMILIDGVPAMNGLAGIYALNAFPTNNIDKVEVLKGASSSVYGSGAIAGVINILTKDPANAPKVSANIELTSKLETVADISAAFKFKKISTILSLSADNSNFRWDNNHDNFMDIPLTNRVAFYNKWSLDRKDKRIATFYARYLFEDRLGGQMNTPDHLTGSDQFYTEWIRTNQWQTGFQYQLPFKEKVL